MKKNKYYVFIISFLYLSVTSFAQQIDTTLQMSGVEVYGKSIQTKNEIIQVNNTNRNQADAGRILQESPNISLIKRGNYASDPVLRGFKGDQIQLMSNGFIQTNAACPNRMDAPISHISLEDLNLIELIKGPYSVRYGMNTGGVVNFQSKDPSSTEKFKVKGDLGLSYQSNGGNKDGHALVQISDKKYFLKVFGGMKDFGNYKSGNGTEILSSFKHSDYGATGAYFINASNKLIIDWKQSFAKDILFAGLPMDGDFDNSSIASVRYLFSNNQKRIFKTEIKVFGNMIDHQMSNTNRPSFAAAQAVSKLNSQTFGGKGEIGVKVSEKLQLFIGIDYKKVAKQGNRERLVFLNTCTGMTLDPPKLFTDAIWQDSYQNDFGAYVESHLQLNEKLNWKAGLRLDMVSSKIDEAAADFQALYPNLGKKDKLAIMANSNLIYLFNDALSLQWSVGLGQRAPDITELYINHLAIGVDAYEYVGNPDLKMEQNFQNDLKFSIHKQKVQFEAAIFYSLMKNYIQANLDTTLSRKYMACMEPKYAKRFENVEDANLYGFETLLAYQIWKGLSASATWAYTIGENKSLDEPLAEIPPMEVQIGLKYKSEKWFASINSRFVMAQDRVSSSFNESTSDAFQTLDFSAQYNIWKGLSLNLNVENLFNTNYVEHLSRAYQNQTIKSLYYEPGRNFIMGINYQF